ncbi:MAG: tRNA1(Val) (adenine(37)-N6)-methyltransferase [Rhizobiaceae bacterium]
MQERNNRPVNAETSLDYFLDHGFAAFQLKNEGHRSGLDAIFLAATLDAESAGQIADFGAGAGVVGLAVAHRCPKTIVDLYEIDSELSALTAQSLNLDENNRLGEQVRNLCCDVGDAARMLDLAGLQQGSYDYVLANPPFNDSGHRISPDQRRAGAHMISGIDMNQWVRSAHRLLRHRGRFNLIIRPSNLDDYLSALRGRFGGVDVLPLHSKKSAPANRLLVGAKKGSKAPMQILPSFTIHRSDGSFTHAAKAILKGQETVGLLA